MLHNNNFAIDSAVFELYVASYNDHGTNLDPNLCNTIFQLYLIFGSILEQNEAVHFEYI